MSVCVSLSFWGSGMIMVRNGLLWYETGYYGPKWDIMVRNWYFMVRNGYFMGIFYLETAQRSAGVVASMYI